MLSSMMLATIQNISFESVYENNNDDAPRFLAELKKLGVEPSMSPEWIIKKTHDVNDINHSDPVIWLVREGRDAMVSYWKFHENEENCKIDPIDFWKTRKGPSNNGVLAMWHDFNNAVVKKLRSTNHLMLRYEDLVSSPTDSLSKVARLLSTTIDKSRLKLVSFDNLHAVNSVFYRKGTVGSATDAGPAALSWLTSHMRPELVKLGYLAESFTMGAGI